MPHSYTYDTYLSPFTFRYGSEAMRALWSETRKRLLWRRVWLALAEAQHEAGLVSAKQFADLRSHAGDLNIERSLEIEKDIHHDLMAELRAFAEQCPAGGGSLHLGATSMDVEDNADALRMCEGLDLIVASLGLALRGLADQIERWAEAPAIAYTHLQPAEPTTIGYRLAQYGQDLLADWHELKRVRASIRGKGFKGAVGTSASYAALLNGSRLTTADVEIRAMSILGLDAFPVTTQTYPRKQDWFVLNALTGLAGTLYKFAFDLRLMQSAPFAEWSEPFSARQVGSSAMPFKRNPINAEKIDSLARYAAGLPRVAWDNAAHSLLERTLDDSANRRLILPEAFLVADELLGTARRLFEGMRIDSAAALRNLETYSVFAGIEPLLMAVCRAGADRQTMHEHLRGHALRAWEALRAGGRNPLVDSLSSDPQLLRHLTAEQVRACLDVSDYVGDAPQRARSLSSHIRQTLAG